jgi:pilus assembly protein Flp/PilA
MKGATVILGLGSGRATAQSAEAADLIGLCKPLPRSKPMKTLFARFVKDESGATAIEYGLIASLIAVAAITAMTTVGSKLGTTFSNVSAKL